MGTIQQDSEVTKLQTLLMQIPCDEPPVPLKVGVTYRVGKRAGHPYYPGHYEGFTFDPEEPGRLIECQVSLDAAIKEEDGIVRWRAGFYPVPVYETLSDAVRAMLAFVAANECRRAYDVIHGALTKHRMYVERRD